MTTKSAIFHMNNRRVLQHSNVETSVFVITGNSKLQSTGSLTFPFVQDTNFFYLTGLEEPGLTLVVEPDAEYLILPEIGRIKIAFDGDIDRESLREVSGLKKIYEYEAGWEKLHKTLASQKTAGILCPPEKYIPVYEMFTNPARQHLLDRLKEKHPKLKYTDLRKQLATQRTVKTDYEVDILKEAIWHSEEVFHELGKKLPEMNNEKEVMALVEDYRLRNELLQFYEPVIASGANAATLHYIDNNSPIDKKYPLMLDIGLKKHGYGADITRTVSLKPSKRQQEVYDAVIEVQNYAFSLLGPGTIPRDYEDKTAIFMGEKLLQLGLIEKNNKENVRSVYPQLTSHFLGLDVHDVGDYEKPLIPGVVMTVEPGIYIKEEKIGVRVEDNILITPNGFDTLTKRLPKSLTSLTITR
jgi:Xaa-Pro aminopeptidase